MLSTLLSSSISSIYSIECLHCEWCWYIQHHILKCYVLQLWAATMRMYAFWLQSAHDSSELQGQFMTQRGLVSYFYEPCVLCDNNNINNHYKLSSLLLIRSHLAVLLCSLIMPWLKSLIGLITFTWKFWNTAWNHLFTLLLFCRFGFCFHQV